MDFFLCIFSSFTCLKKPVFSKPDCCSTTYPVVLSDVFFLCDFLCSSWWLQDLDFSATIKKYQNIQPVLVLVVVVILVSGKMSCKIFHTRMQNTFTTNKVPKHSTCFPTCFCVFWFCSDVGECQNLWQNLWHKSAKTHFQSKRNYSQAKKTLK